MPRAVLASVLGLFLTSCERPPRKIPSVPSPPPSPLGAVVAAVEVAVPAGQSGRVIHAGLKRDGRIVARGTATIPAIGGEPVKLNLQAMSEGQAVGPGDYELWLTINRDELAACHPSFGDLFIREKWQIIGGENRYVFPDASVWKERRASRPENIVTIHYHRYDEDYADVGIWSWDSHHKHSPADNELHEVGRDDFGLVYQFDLVEYGHSDRIGLLPRLGASWDRKDGDDKFWRPSLGREIYLIGTRREMWTSRPETSPHVANAWLDAADRLVVQLSRMVSDAEVRRDSCTVTDDQGVTVPVSSTRVLKRDGQAKSNFVELTTAAPMNAAARTYRVSVMGFGGAVRAALRGVLDDADLFCDRDAVMGATYAKEATTFRVFAPTASRVEVVLYDEVEGNRGRRAVAMSRAGKGIWSVRVSGDWEGKFYMYRLEGDGLLPDDEVLDIYATNAVNSSRRARITDLTTTNPAGWEKSRRGPAVKSPVDMVVYEMHVRDFTIADNSGVKNKGKYLGFAEGGTHLRGDPTVKTGLDHLVELGVTHVQLLPVQDFDNNESVTNYNWGYVTTAFNTPEGWFASDVCDESRIREFKRLVAALHERGLGVIMDVVYNHTSANAPFNGLVPKYYYRTFADGSYANGSGCGNDFRSESPMGRKFIVDSLKYWVEEYGVDGFRFDLMALIDLETMKEVERELRAINPHIVIYGEPWSAGPSPLRGEWTTKQTVRGTKIGAFNDHFRNALKGSPDGHEPGFIQNGSHMDGVRKGMEGSFRDWADQPWHSINYMTCHDNLVLYDKLQKSRADVGETEWLDMMKLGYVALFTAQGVPFIHGGEEFARTKQGHHNSYNAPDSINQVDWALKKKNHALFRYVRDLVQVRRDHPVFRMRAKEQIAAWTRFVDLPDSDAVMWLLDAGHVDGESWKSAAVLLNASDSMSVDVPLPPGRWSVVLDHNGAVTQPRAAEGTVRVRYKSGMILSQP